MVLLWFTKIRLGLSELYEVPSWHYDDVLEKLVDAGLYDEQGNKLTI